MSRPAMLQLTESEELLLREVRFAVSIADGREAVVANGRRAAQLMLSLTNRRAIPETRWRYFTDPEYFPAGRGKSHLDVFRGNGCASAEEVYTHPHFLRYLRYFVHGPNLPARTIAAFGELSDGPFREIERVRRFVRQAAREHSGPEVAEEIFKLAVECGYSVADARLLRTDAMMASRPRR